MAALRTHLIRSFPAGLLLCAALLAGCSADWYKERADTQVYGIIAETQQQELSRSRAFTIEPPPAATVELEQLKPLATGAEIETKRIILMGDPAVEKEMSEPGSQGISLNIGQVIRPALLYLRDK